MADKQIKHLIDGACGNGDDVNTAKKIQYFHAFSPLRLLTGFRKAMFSMQPRRSRRFSPDQQSTSAPPETSTNPHLVRMQTFSVE